MRVSARERRSPSHRRLSTPSRSPRSMPTPVFARPALALTAPPRPAYFVQPGRTPRPAPFPRAGPAHDHDAAPVGRGPAASRPAALASPPSRGAGAARAAVAAVARRPAVGLRQPLPRRMGLLRVLPGPTRAPAGLPRLLRVQPAERDAARLARLPAAPAGR